ncbi:MAG TPA: LLM class flavin-dependent oxidoreductase, partial [Stellaceae bacterium]|nr:LLM class flavin-dependent oxidoreductase [Stellaceae bacterium]
MKFAHFAHVWGKKGMTPAQRYEQLWRELQLCDELGFDYGFCVEHHFSPHESWMSAPSLYTVGAGARTKRIRLGGMGHVVPLHQSLRLAEELAIADQMLGGRLDIGLVPGITPRIFEPFGVAFDNRREVTLEFVKFLRAAFAGTPEFTFHGKYHHAENVPLSVPPVQKPCPPL